MVYSAWLWFCPNTSIGFDQRAIELKRFAIPKNMYCEVTDESIPGSTITTNELTLYVRDTRRAVAKIAYGFLCCKIPSSTISSSSFEPIRNYVCLDEGPDLSAPNLADTKFMVDGLRPLHKVHIHFDVKRKLTVGYVSIFGAFRYTVLLSDSFVPIISYPDFDYTVDPIRGKEVPINNLFTPRSISKERVTKPKHTEEEFRAELDAGLKVIADHSPFIVESNLQVDPRPENPPDQSK